MPYEIGDTVIHPQHGAATVEDVKERKFAGEDTTYLVLELHDDSMTIMVPAETVEEIGLRDTIDKGDLDEILEILEQEPMMTEASWQKRRAKNASRLKSGDPVKIARVIRDLAHRHEIKRLSPTEKRQRIKAEEFLAGEIAAMTSRDVEDAFELLYKHVDIEDAEAEAAA